MNDIKEQLNSEIITKTDINDVMEKINEALPIKSFIEGTLKIKLKGNKKEFTDYMFKAFPEFNDKDCQEYKEIKAINNNLIDAIVEYEKMKDLPEIRTKLESLIIKLKWLLLVSKYIDFDFVETLMLKHGLNVKFESLAQNPNFNEDIKQALKVNVGESIEITNEIDNKQKNEVDQLFESLSTGIKFDKQNNPKGLKVGTFNELTKLEILKRTNSNKAKEKFESLQKNIDDKALSDLFTKTIALSIVE